MGERRPSLGRMPSLKAMKVEEGGLTAALTSPERRASLKPTFTRDSSRPKLDTTATARRSQPSGLLAEVRRVSADKAELEALSGGGATVVARTTTTTTVASAAAGITSTRSITSAVGTSVGAAAGHLAQRRPDHLNVPPRGRTWDSPRVGDWLGSPPSQLRRGA